MDNASRDVLDYAAVQGNDVQIKLTGGEFLISKVQPIDEGFLLVKIDTWVAASDIAEARHDNVGHRRRK